MAPRPPTLRPISQSTRPSSRSNPYKTSHKAHKARPKKFKRVAKPAPLLARIKKSAPGTKVSKRRRPSKKLVTNLKALADALPESTSANARAGGGGVTSGEGGEGRSSIRA
ncbi:hypothetical protein ABVK25_006761 [Lepraria finkii]|uniref:Ribosome biogenesis protein SLX9 n=1 Tax=Lepraria finkii TaxID=1340010 RepID=A0ABR4B4L9_9LECA